MELIQIVVEDVLANLSEALAYSRVGVLLDVKLLEHFLYTCDQVFAIHLKNYITYTSPVSSTPGEWMCECVAVIVATVQSLCR